MLPFEVDPGWYDQYWFSDRPRPKRRSFAGGLTRFAVLAALLAGSGAVLSHYHVDQDAPAYQSWEQE